MRCPRIDWPSSRMAGAAELDYIIPTVEVDPDSLDKLDTKNSVRDRDGYTVKTPSPVNACPIQLWEVYIVIAVLMLQPHSQIIFAHVKALCEHQERRFLCETLLKEHTSIGAVTDVTQEISLYSFIEEYLNRKFDVAFQKNSLLRYLLDVIDDPLCGKFGIARVFLLAPYVQAFLLGADFFEAQYDELLDSMRQYNLPVNDVLTDSGQDIGEFVEMQWDNLQMYDDPTLILKKHGGWAIAKGSKMATQKDQLISRLTGVPIETILTGQGVPDSPRRDEDTGKHKDKADGGAELSITARTRGLTLADDDGSSSSSHPSDFDIDPEHVKVTPFGMSYCETFLLLRGILMSQEATWGAWKNSVIGEQTLRSCKDRHMLAAAVLVDLYVREQIDVCHWTLKEGDMAVPYQIFRKRAGGHMNHFLDFYTPHCESIFRDMRLPPHVAEGPIWKHLEERGLIENCRESWRRGFFGKTRYLVWDLARPDVLLDMKEGYLVAAQTLYNRSFYEGIIGSPMMEEAHDVCMFVYLLQAMFDRCFEAIDGMARVMTRACPPFCKGELFPPHTQVHGAAVCLGLIDRGFRVGKCSMTDMAAEAAEFNEVVMTRLEQKFFLSPKIWQSFDVDASGELSIEEFIEGMRHVDVYNDFRKERVPEEVLRLILMDLAQKLFQEVDLNGDGTLTADELKAAFRRRRDEAEKAQSQSQWYHLAMSKVQEQLGLGRKSQQMSDESRERGERVQKTEKTRSVIEEHRQRLEWSSEVDKVEMLDADVDVD